MIFNMRVRTEIRDQRVLDGMKDALAELMFLMEGEAVRKVPVDTGRLKNSIHLDRVDDFLWILADGVEYGVHVEYGTSPHMITPKTKKALAFEIDKKKIVVKKVMHPGTVAQPFMRPALNMGKLKTPEVVQKYLS